MRKNKGITLTSLVIYITVMFVVLVALMRIVGHFRDNISEVTETSFETEFQKINLYLLDESKRLDESKENENERFRISDNHNQIEFVGGNRYTYNQEDKAIYLNDNIKLCEQVESCMFTQEPADNGDIVIKLSIKIYDQEKEVEYVMPNAVENSVQITERRYILDSLATYEEARKDANGYLKENAIYTSDNDTAIIPKGFKVSDIQEPVDETNISTGLVIKDSHQNEFVWIPILQDLVNPYVKDESRSKEPAFLTAIYSNSGDMFDSQTTLNYLYGANKFNYFREFDYKTEYSNMIKKVNKYQGFYIARYETTIDQMGNIGSVYNTPILTADKNLFTENSTNYAYRWYGLYYTLKTTSFITGNGTTVQTAMIYGQLWDATMDYIRKQNIAEKTNYNVDQYKREWHSSSYGHTAVVNSGKYNTEDIALNIYDLEGNALEYTQQTYDDNLRIFRGGSYESTGSANSTGYAEPRVSSASYSSRMILYVK